MVLLQLVFGFEPEEILLGRELGTSLLLGWFSRNNGLGVGNQSDSLELRGSAVLEGW